MKSPKISDKNLFFYLTKRNLPMMLFFALGSVLAVNVSTMMYYSAMRYDINHDYTTETEVYENFASGIGMVLIIIACVCAVFAGCVAFRFLMGRKSAIIFGSLPQTRIKQFFSAYFSGAICFVAPFILVILAQASIFAVWGKIAFFPIFLSFALQAFMWFFFFYTLTVFSGMLCAMTSIQFLLTMAILAYLPATYALLISASGSLYSSIYMQYYLNMSVLSHLSPVAMLYKTFRDTFTVSIAVSYIIATLILFALSYLLYRIRNNTRAGQTVAFPVVGSVVKYLLMFTCTVFGGYIFGITTSSGAWTFVGCIIFAFLSFMVLNAIINKNVRALFKNWKGFIVFLVIMVAGCTLMLADPMNLDGYTPQKDNVSYVTFETNGTDIDYHDGEMIDAIYEFVDESETVLHDSEAHSEMYSYTGYYSDDYLLSSRIVYHTKSGIPIAKFVYTYDYETYQKYLNLLIRSEDYEEKIKQILISSNGISAGCMTKYENKYMEERISLASYGTKQFIGAYLKTIENGGIYRSDAGPVVANVNLNGMEIPIYLSDKECISALLENNQTPLEGIFPDSSSIDKYIENITDVIVTDNDGNEETFTDKDKILSLYLNSAGYTFSYDSLYASLSESGDEVMFNCGDDTVLLTILRK